MCRQYSDPYGYEPSEGGRGAQRSGSSMQAVAQLFARLSQEIEEQKPKNCIHFIVDFLCKHYPEHLHGFASIWQMDPDLEKERHEVVNFFKAHKISTAIAAHFTNAGYDTLDTLTTLNKESLVDVEAFNNVKWLPGHKVRLQQIFSEIHGRVRAYRQHCGNVNAARPTASKPYVPIQTSGYTAPPVTTIEWLPPAPPVYLDSAGKQQPAVVGGNAQPKQLPALMASASVSVRSTSHAH